MAKLGMVIASILVSTSLAVGASGAESESPGQTEEKADIFVGFGAVVSGEPYEGVSSNVYPVPLFGYEGERLYLRGITGGYRLIKAGGWSIGPTLRPRFDGYDASDSSALRGMDDRRASIDGGVDLSWRTDWGLISTVFVTDLLGEHDGQELEVSYTIMFPYAGFTVIPSVGARWRSQQLAEYYYGVRPDEVRAGRPAYKPDAAITPVASVALRRELSEKWGFLLAAQYEWLDDEIRDSPIVDDNSTLSMLLGLTYTF